MYLFTIRNLRILNLIKIILFETFEVYLFTIRNLRMIEKSENFQHYPVHTLILALIITTSTSSLHVEYV